MKLKGEIPGRNTVTVNIRRGDKIFTLVAKTIIDIDEFKRLCPEPQMPQMVRPSGEKIPNPNDKQYKESLADHGQKQTDWVIIKSLSETEGLVWEKVKPEDNGSWKFWKEELEQAGFSNIEIAKVINAVSEANGLTDEMLDGARNAFLPVDLPVGV